MSYALVEQSGAERVVHVLREGDQTVGRSSESDIQLSHSSVSRHHARIVVDGARVTVIDLGSRNGTFVGGGAVSGETDVSPGAEVVFAGVTMTEPIYTVMSAKQFTLYPLMIMCFSLVAALYPAFYAARLTPSKAMRKSM